MFISFNDIKIYLTKFSINLLLVINMKLNKTKQLRLFSTLLLFGAFTIAGVGVVKRYSNYLHVYGEDANYSLIFNSSSRVTDSTSFEGLDDLSSSFKTSNNNSLNLSYFNIIKNSSGWQTIKEGGYVYNPVNESLNNNKISGIKSICISSESEHKLTLYYGWSLDNEQIVYSKYGELENNVVHEIENGPAYFKLVNEGSEDIDVTSLLINYSCKDTSYPKNDLKVLMIGNSFADDTTTFTRQIASSYGINLTTYDAYVASCTIDKHLNYLNSEESVYAFNGDTWWSGTKTLKEILTAKEYDLITFQQASAVVGDTSSYDNLSTLVDQVRDIVGDKPKFTWYQTWAYENDYMLQDGSQAFSKHNNDGVTMFNNINAAYNSEVKPLSTIEGMIAGGTAVQNLRTSFLGESFSRDGLHMSSSVGRYLVGLNFVSNILDIDLKQSPCSYRPDGVYEDSIPALYEAIDNARKYPQQVTQSVYTQSKMGSYDLSNYVEIDPGFVGCSYWDSTDPSNFNKRICNSNGASNLNISTKQFNKETLPVGSLVFINDGFGFLADGWKGDYQHSSKASSDTFDDVLEITDSWWGSFNKRAFNIFMAGKNDLMGQYDNAFNAFHIYVPIDKAFGLEKKTDNPYAESDRDLFTSNYLKFDSFERIHLDPITGFYKCDSYSYQKNSFVDDTAKKFVCTRPFFSRYNELPGNTVIVCDSGYQWRSDCWNQYGYTSSRPSNVSNPLTKCNAEFFSSYRVRTFNVSATNSSYVGQNHISFMNHMRIYVPISEDIEIEHESNDLVTIAARGTVNLNAAGQQALGSSSVPLTISINGISDTSISISLNSNSATALYYSYDKDTGELSIETNGGLYGFTYGVISGVVNTETGTITNITFTGTLSNYISNNGSITCASEFFDRCEYSTNALSQQVWQRWYMNGSWTANTGTGEWTTSNDTYALEGRYSMGLRIANSSYQKTSFTLKNDLGNGSGVTVRGITLYIYNPNSGVNYSSVRIYAYTTPSTQMTGYVKPSSNYSEIFSQQLNTANQWIKYEYPINGLNVYNIRLYVQTDYSSTTMLYLGYIAIY